MNLKILCGLPVPMVVEAGAAVIASGAVLAQALGVGRDGVPLLIHLALRTGDKVESKVRDLGPTS